MNPYVKDRLIREPVNWYWPYQMPLVDINQPGEVVVEGMNSYHRSPYRQYLRLPSLLLPMRQWYPFFQESQKQGTGRQYPLSEFNGQEFGRGILRGDPPCALWPNPWGHVQLRRSIVSPPQQLYEMMRLETTLGRRPGWGRYWSCLHPVGRVGNLKWCFRLHW